MRRTLGAVALCGLLAGCGGANQMYYQAGAAPAQTAEAAYWDCVGQGWTRPNAAWLPLPAAQGMGAAETMQFVNYCMYQKGWTPKPHLELTTMTWVPYQPPR